MNWQRRFGCSFAMLAVLALAGCMDDVQADAGPDQAVDGGATVTLDGSSSKPQDPGRLAFSWEQIEGPTVTLSAPTAAVTTFDAPQSASESRLMFKLTATYVDFAGEPYPPNSASDEVLVRVRADRTGTDATAESADATGSQDTAGTPDAQAATDGSSSDGAGDAAGSNGTTDNGTADNEATPSPESASPTSS